MRATWLAIRLTQFAPQIVKCNIPTQQLVSQFVVVVVVVVAAAAASVAESRT